MTYRYAAIGNPISHSKSPQIHSAFAEQTGQEMAYGLIEGPLGQFKETVDRFRDEGAKGLNITAPFKLDAFAYAEDLSDGARAAGAVSPSGPGAASRPAPAVRAHPSHTLLR